MLWLSRARLACLLRRLLRVLHVHLSRVRRVANDVHLLPAGIRGVVHSLLLGRLHYLPPTLAIVGLLLHGVICLWLLLLL